MKEGKIAEIRMVGIVGRGALRLTVVALVSVFVAFIPASAIINGTVDSVHTYVGAFIGEAPNLIDPSFPFRLCSGTLVSEGVFLTAAHCGTLGVTLDKLWVSFADNFLQDRKSWRAVSAVMPHPDFTLQSVYAHHDMEVVILEKPVKDITPGTLPPLDFLDGLASSGVLHDAKFSILGYGRSENLALTGDRRIASVGFKSLHNETLALSMNLAQGEGLLCFSDSGGPALFDAGGTEYLVGVNAVNGGSSFDCVGGFADESRVDTVSAQNFILGAIAANT